MYYQYFVLTEALVFRMRFTVCIYTVYVDNDVTGVHVEKEAWQWYGYITCM